MHGNSTLRGLRTSAALDILIVGAACVMVARTYGTTLRRIDFRRKLVALNTCALCHETTDERVARWRKVAVHASCAAQVLIERTTDAERNASEYAQPQRQERRPNGDGLRTLDTGSGLLVFRAKESEVTDV